MYGRAMPPKRCKDEYTYTKINKLVPGITRVNIYGVLEEVLKELTPMTTGKYNGRILIRDETCAPGKSLLIHFFIPSCVNFPILEKGVIIRLHRVKLETFNDIVDGRIFSSNDLAVFPREPDPDDTVYSTAGSVQFTANDKARLVQLRSWISTWWDTPTLAVTASNSTSLGKNDGVNNSAKIITKLTSPDKNIGIHNGGGNTTKPTLPSKEKKSKEIINIDISPTKEVRELPKKPEDNILIPTRERCTQKRLNPAYFNSSKSRKKQELKTSSLAERTYKTCSETNEASPQKSDPMTEKMCVNSPKSGGTDSDSPVAKRLIVLLEKCSTQPSTKRLKTLDTKDRCVPVQDNQVNGLMERKPELQGLNSALEYSNFSFFDDPSGETSSDDRERSMEPPGCSSFSAPLSTSHATEKKKKPPNTLGNLAEENTRNDQSECPGQACASRTCESESHLGSGPVFTNMEEDDGNDTDVTLLEEPNRQEMSKQLQYLPFQLNVEATPVNLRTLEDFSWPLYRVNVQIVQMKPSIHALKTCHQKDLLSGLCKECWRSTMYSQLRWKWSKPGCKMPLCPHCMEAGVENFVCLDFKFKLIVKDAWGTTLKMVAMKRDASEFLGCTVRQYQSRHEVREATVKNLEALKCGRFFNIIVRKIRTQVESQYHISQTTLESLLQS